MILRMSARRDQSEWSRIVARFERSGKTAEEFCVRRGLKASTLKWWRWKLSRGGAHARTEAVELVPVHVVARVPEHMAEPRTLVVSVAGVDVRVEIGTEARYVAELVAELRARC
jgi:transposase